MERHAVAITVWSLILVKSRNYLGSSLRRLDMTWINHHSLATREVDVYTGGDTGCEFCRVAATYARILVAVTTW